MSSTICPLYKKVINAEPWKQKQSAHAGLLFDKYPSYWQKNSGEYKFEKSDFLNDFLSVSFPGNLIEEACQRQRDMVEKMGGEIIVLKNSSRFVTGMGREHPLENGFTWHHTLGVPFLPGSSLKGILRAWCRENGTWDEKKEKWIESDQLKKDFGSQKNGVGKFICLDMLPLETPKLVVEIMTPHYGPYYQDDTGKTAPGDWHNPVPIPFLAVEAGTTWQLALLPGPAHRAVCESKFEELKEQLPKALSWLGAGAKTAVGYGRFEHQPVIEKELEQKDLERIQELARLNEREAVLSSLSPSRRKIEELAEKHQWKSDTSAFLEKLEQLINEKFEFDEDSILWVKEAFLEDKWKGIWENPDAKKGKKKKPKFNPRGAAIVHNLQDFLKSIPAN